MVSVEKFNLLLDKSRTIIDHQWELKKARGENFNVFSILKMERSENKTHSAFLAELLDPKGSHLKENIFLQFFLKVLKEKKMLKGSELDHSTAQVKLEYYLGPRKDKAKEGGRIDIYIWDRTGNSISIENKIDAGDQDAQIERYCNYKKAKNIVFYLTLKGEEPPLVSKGELQSGTDFYTISYRDHILEWLDRCIKESAEQPILRESIKQYKILIQKLTATMDKKHQQDLNEIMLKHIRESAYIAANFAKVSTDLKEKVRQNVIRKLKERLEESYQVVAGNKADWQYSQVWIKIKGFEKSKIHFGLESFSGQGHQNGGLFMGVVNFSGKKNPYTEASDSFNKYWMNVVFLTAYQQHEMHLGRAETLQKLHSDKEFYEGFITHIVEEVGVYLAQHTEALREFLEKED